MSVEHPEDVSELLRLRREKLEAWRARGVDPFGQQFADTQPNAHILENYQEGKAVRAAGRLVSIRPMGKAAFAHILDSTGKLQLYAQRDALGESFDDWKLLDLGDFVGVEGTLFQTKTGEKTLRVTSQRILSKSLRPIPTQWYGLADVEARYRQRYLDLIVNDQARHTLAQRSRIVWEVRNFLEKRGFLEVETPMMQTIAGGAAAKPFVTHHNALNIPLFLRIAPELFLKRLLVGGFEKIFEINRNFRNEGISRRHNPEFTMLEIYWAYENFESMADLMESMACQVAKNVLGGYHVPAQPAGEHSIGRAALDLTPPWPRRRYKDLVREAAGADWFELTPEQRRTKAVEWQIHLTPQMADHEVTHQVFEKLVEAKIVNPVFVTHMPKHLIPLAKQNAQDPEVIDVFDLIIAGQEVGTGYSELNDPIVQRRRLEEQVGEEVQLLDEDFLAALEYGMPPAGGLGFGIDRFVMTLTGAESIRDVILFPLLKPRKAAAHSSERPPALAGQVAEFSIDRACLERFPECAVGGFAVEQLERAAAVLAQGRAAELMAQAQAHLQGLGLKVEDLAKHPAIAPWREAYSACGLKPSQYRSAHEQLARRLLNSGTLQLPLPVAQAYCAISLKHLAPLGACDMDRVAACVPASQNSLPLITLRRGRPGTDRFEPLGGKASDMPITDKVIVYACEDEVLCWSFNHRDSARTCLAPQTRRAVFFSESVSAPRHEAMREALAELAALLLECGAQVGPVQVATADHPRLVFGV